MTLGRAMKVRVRTGMFNADKLEVITEDILQATHAPGSIRICRVTAHRLSIRSKNRTARKIYGAQAQTLIPAWVRLRCIIGILSRKGVTVSLARLLDPVIHFRKYATRERVLLWTLLKAQFRRRRRRLLQVRCHPLAP